MSQRDSQKKREVNIEEEKDFYLSFVNKKVRNIRKKLEQIDLLVKKGEDNLKPEQLEKVRTREEVVQSIKYYEDLKDIYYNAYKVGLEENKISLPERSSEMTSEKNAQASEAPKVEKAPKSEADSDGINVEQIKEETTRKTLQKVINLLLVGKFFEDATNKETFLKNNGLQLVNGQTQIDETEKFYKSLFDFTPVNEPVNISEKYNQITEKLTNYVQATSNDAKPVFELVETVANSTDFKNITINPKSQSNVLDQPEPVKTNEEVVQQQIIEQLLPGADLLKPDTDDVNRSPENMKYLPKDVKTIKFVDELEREQMPGTNTDHTSVEGATGEEALKKSEGSQTQNESAKSPEETEQRSFRKNRSGKNEISRNTTDNQKKRANNHKESKTEDDRRGYNKQGYNKNDGYYKRRHVEYEVKQYVEKKPTESK